MSDDKLKDILSKKFEGYEKAPSKDSWDRISKSLDNSSSEKGVIFYLYRIGSVAAVLGIVALTYFYLAENDSPSQLDSKIAQNDKINEGQDLSTENKSEQEQIQAKSITESSDSHVQISTENNAESQNKQLAGKTGNNDQNLKSSTTNNSVAAQQRNAENEVADGAVAKSSRATNSKSLKSNSADKSRNRNTELADSRNAKHSLLREDIRDISLLSNLMVPAELSLLPDSVTELPSSNTSLSSKKPFSGPKIGIEYFVGAQTIIDQQIYQFRSRNLYDYAYGEHKTIQQYQNGLLINFYAGKHWQISSGAMVHRKTDFVDYQYIKLVPDMQVNTFAEGLNNTVNYHSDELSDRLVALRDKNKNGPVSYHTSAETGQVGVGTTGNTGGNSPTIEPKLRQAKLHYYSIGVPLNIRYLHKIGKFRFGGGAGFIYQYQFTEILQAQTSTFNYSDFMRYDQTIHHFNASISANLGFQLGDRLIIEAEPQFVRQLNKTFESDLFPQANRNLLGLNLGLELLL